MNYVLELEDAAVGDETFTRTFGGKTKHPFYHPSNTPDTLIKNAVTGVFYPWKTGSVESRRLFKIVDSLGRYDSSGVKLKPTSPNYPNPNPNQCYYDSPQQYMTHTRCVVKPELIESWKTRQNNIFEQDLQQ